MLGSVKDLFFKITGKDASGPAFGSVNRRLRETDGLAANMGERMDRAGRKMMRFGAAGTLATAGIAAAFRDVVGLYDDHERSEAKVAQAIRQTGGAAGFTKAQLTDLASDLQELTRFGDEAILNGVTAQLLTFTNITGDSFTRAQMAALDLATVLDGDVQSAALALGKALADPIARVGELSRSGIILTQTQKDLIKSFAEAGDMAAAQAVILDEVEAVYGGQAQAARESGAGIVDAWRNTWGDVKEEIGAVVVDALPPLIDGLKSLTGWFQDLEPAGKKTVVTMGAIALAIPPVTVALGALTLASRALMGPWGWAITAAGLLASAVGALWPHIDKSTESTDVLTEAMGDEISQSQLLQQAISGDISLSISAAKQKLSEAQARHENVKAIIAEQRALRLNSSGYQTILEEIENAGAVLNSLGFPSNDAASFKNAEAFEAAQQRLVELRREQMAYLKIDDQLAEQLERTGVNIQELEAAIKGAEGGMVSFGDGMVVPIETAERLKDQIAGGGGTKTGSLTGALEELTAKTEELGQSEGWDSIKSNFRALVTGGQSWGETWRNILGDALDRLFDFAFSPAWDSLWANLAKTASAQSGGGGGGLMGGLLAGATNWVGNILGLDTGGDVTVSGKAGVDRNLTVLRTSDSENVSVRRKGDMGGTAPVVVNIYARDPNEWRASRGQIARDLGRAVSTSQRFT